MALRSASRRLGVVGAARGGGMRSARAFMSRGVPPGRVDETLRGVGQVCFANCPTAGALVLGGLFVADPALAAMAVGGSAVATEAARQAGLDEGARAAGMYGYNGCLVGCAMCVFVPMSGGSVLPAVAAATAGAAVSPLVSAALKPALGPVPQWTLAFNLTTLAHLARLTPLAKKTDDAPPPSDVLATDLFLAPLKGLSQIFVAESSLGGLCILGALASYSPASALYAVGGSLVGCTSGFGALGATLPELAAGLYGFNAALTSLAISVFFVETRTSQALAIGGALATTVLFAGLKTGLGVHGVPALTLPFCAIATGCYLLGHARVVPGLVLAREPHSPERNRA